MRKSIEQIRIDQARRNPYNGRAATDQWELAAQAVLADLCDRSVIKHALHKIEDDEQISEELITSLAAIIRAAVNSGVNAK